MKIKRQFQNRYAYLEIAADDPWFNNQAYVDTLNKRAIETFVEITHENIFKN